MWVDLSTIGVAGLIGPFACSLAKECCYSIASVRVVLSAILAACSTMIGH